MFSKKGGILKKRRLEKENIVKELKQKLVGANAIFVSDYRGLKVNEMTELRRRLREHNTEYRVVKNTLTRLAVQDTPLQDLQRFIDGPLAIAFSMGEPVKAAKVLQGFSTEFPALKLKGGFLGESLLMAEDVEKLSKLPSRDVLVGRLLGLFKILPARLINALNSLPQRLVITLVAIQKGKEG